MGDIISKATESELVRDDYKEVMAMAKLLMTKDASAFSFMEPGDIHMARWMAKLLNTMKMVLLFKKIEAELHPGAVFEVTNSRQKRSKQKKEVQLEKLVRLLKFVVAVNIPWRVTCGSATDAPQNDLLLLKVMGQYQAIDSQVVEVTFQALRWYPATTSKPFSGHLWYLTQEMLPLLLFSPHIPDDVKASVAKAILQSEKSEEFVMRKGNGFGRPLFQQTGMYISEVSGRRLEDFVGPDSWKFFQVLGLDSSFLNEPVSSLPSLENWAVASKALNQLQVKNDAAERGVKLGRT